MPWTKQRTLKLDRDEPDDRSPLAQRPDAREEPGRRQVRRRLASLVITVAVLAAVALLGFGLLYSRSTPSPGPSVSPVTVGADGITAQIDGQRVYRVSEQAEWQTLSGSFLLGGYAVSLPKSCPISAVPTLPSEADLVDCGSVELLPNPMTISPGFGPAALTLAPLGSSLLGGWEGGSAIVVRVHTHDPEATRCGTDIRAACEAAVVVEAVVWPMVPSEIAGEHVYRATEQASFVSLKGSFLLGGLVAYPAVVPPCPSVAGPPGDGQGLLPYCYWPSIDGLALSPKGSFDEPGNEIVVARVHVNDPLAAECQPSVRAECETAIVVESVAWRSNPYATPTPSGTPASSSSAAAIESPSASPDPLRYEDGIPRTFDGQPVLRWSDALALRLTAKDDTPFLVAAWLDVITGPMFCPNMPVDPSAPDSWASDVCTGETVSAEAGGPYSIGQEASFRFIQSYPSTGPAILRVHVHDPRAVQCGTQRAICDAMLVVESVVWSGDSYTAPEPLTVADVIAAASSVQPSTSLVIAGPMSPYYDERLPGALRLTPSNPAQTPPSDMQIAGAYLMPSVEAMQRALPSVQPGAAGALLPTAYRIGTAGSGPGYSYSLVYRWLVVDNVALSVEMLPDASAADRAWLGNLEAALKARR
jgi:hypothetical protein